MHNWATSDEDEINRRRWRAETEAFRVVNEDAAHPIFSNFLVDSKSGLRYSVEIRDIATRQFHCQCVDFRISGLGTCKHVEAVLAHLEARFKRLFKAASTEGSGRTEVILDPKTHRLRVVVAPNDRVPRLLQEWFSESGRLRAGTSPEEVVAALRDLVSSGRDDLRLSQEIDPWLDGRRRAEERKRLRHQYELKVQAREWPAHETKVPLFPYQRDGMLHLAFGERALLADEMGLGKTIQAIAACALLRRLGQVQRVLVVTPASLKTEWEEQIQRFTDLPYQLVFGARYERLRAYDMAGPLNVPTPETKPEDAAREAGVGPVFTIVNYEQMLADSLEVNARLRPDLVVLDEAQRIKNWSTKTTQAIKRLRSRYAFVLTGTPIENRIDELYSIMDFLDPTVLGPLFRFNREYYSLNERGRPDGYRNLEQLHERVRPFLLRRRKADVETELPKRTDRNHFVTLTPEQVGEYDHHEAIVARLGHAARRRPLTKQAQEKLMRHLAMMRMVCDTNFILDPEDRSSSKIPELEKILEEIRENAGAKVIIFSEWERMLELVRDLCERLDLGYAWHTGSVPQRRRRAEINAFKQDPACRIFLSTDSGSTGLNLQVASVVINCDLPWNPARLEQRIARAWRKHQTQPVTVINLVAENTIEEKMLSTLAHKQALADGVLDGRGNLSEVEIRTGAQAFFAKLEQLGLSTRKSALRPAGSTGAPQLPVDRAVGFARAARQQIDGALVRCEERYPQGAVHSVLYVVVDENPGQWRARLTELHTEYFHDADPLAPVRLEVVDRATDDAVLRLIDAGVIARTVRASRPLDQSMEPTGAPAPLNEVERAQAKAHRDQAARKLKMARLLGDTGFSEEARPPLLEAACAVGRALALEARLPEPASLDDALLPPCSHCWSTALPVVRSFQSDPSSAWGPMADALETILR